jgi:hypothetical protein
MATWSLKSEPEEPAESMGDRHWTEEQSIIIDIDGSDSDHIRICCSSARSRQGGWQRDGREPAARQLGPSIQSVDGASVSTI